MNYKLNSHRILNYLLLKWSYWKSLIMRKPVISGVPMAVSIEPVNFCNLQCPECVVGNGSLTRNKQLLPIENFKIIVDKLPSDLLHVNLYFQGEPMLHPQFAEMVKIAGDKNIFTSTSSNGHFLFDKNKVKELITSGLGKIIVSIDGTTQETYEKYRKNGDLSQVITGIKTLVDLKKEMKRNNPFVELQFLVMAHNEHQIPDIKRLAKSLQVDKLSLKSTQVYDFENGSELIPYNPKYSRYYRKKDGKYYLKGKLKNCCWRQWSSAVIAVNGDVLPCCFDKNGNYSFGNLFEQTLQEIWMGKKANDFRQKVIIDRKNIAICRNCTETS